jgi:hypothetical protein
MIDLMHISEEELHKLWIDDPNILEELVQESELDYDDLAVVFVKHPMLQDIILRYKDAEELYNTVYKSQVENTNPGDYEHNWDEYQEVHEEYVNALNAIKNYVSKNPEYSDHQFVENLAYAPVEVLNWDDPYGIIRQAEQEKALQGLVDKILSNPEEMDEVFRTTDDLQGLYEMLENEIYSDNIVFDDAEMNHNSIIKDALEKLSKNYVLDENLDYLDEEVVSITDEDLKEADEQVEEFFAEHPELDDRPDSQIPEGMSTDEYAEAIGVTINEFGEIIREGKQETKTSIPSELEEWLNGGMSPLKKREEELSKLEKEEKTISEAEALIDKQNAKKGQSIGE